MQREDNVISPGCEVVMHFAIKLEDGTVADSTHNLKEPARIIIGDGTLTEALEEKLLGLRAGDKTQLKISPEDGFGMPNPENIQSIPRSQFPADMELEEGLIIVFTQPNGTEIPGIIRAISEQDVIVDFNHPLSGHNLIFDVEIVAVKNNQ